MVSLFPGSGKNVFTSSSHKLLTEEKESIKRNQKQERNLENNFKKDQNTLTGEITRETVRVVSLEKNKRTGFSV